MNQVTLNLMHLSPSTIQVLIQDLKEHADTSYTAVKAIQELTRQLIALVGEEEAEEMLS